MFATKMSVDNAIFFVLAIFFAANFERIAAQCVQRSPCSCVQSNGEGYDLSKIDTDGKGVLKTAIPYRNYTFFFHPCKDLRMNGSSTDNSECASGVSLCAYDAGRNTNVSYGTVDESTMSILANEMYPSIVLRHKNKDVVVNTTTITLICNTGSTRLLVDEADTPNIKLFLLSTHACKTLMVSTGLSTGSVLVILLFVFSGVYLIGGALAMKFLRGATGWEMLPNHTFWSDLPALVRDGITFCISGCKAESYDQI